MDSLSQINKALGTQLRDERFNEWAYAAWRRMESLLRIESPLRARKRRRVTLDNGESCLQHETRVWCMAN